MPRAVRSSLPRLLAASLAALAAACAPQTSAPPPVLPQAALPGPSAMPVAVWFDDYNEVLAGTFTRYGYLFPRTVDVSGRVGRVRCVGTAPVKIVPPDADPPRRCDGIRGMATLTCSDERALLLEWIADPECASGYGKGQDAEGNRVHVVYGGSRERAESAVREALRAQREKPALPAAGTAGRKGGVGIGTAFFVSWEGHLLTNHHVVDKASRVQVKLDDGDLIDARVLSRDPDHDLALLKVDAIRTPLPVRRKSELARGREVAALGYPLVPLQGPDQKATIGHVNALQGIQGDDRYTQIDAPIQPGNSGGPLLNRNGEVVGVVTMILNPIATARATGVIPQNVNYALKSDYAHRMLRRQLGASWKSEEAGAPAEDWAELIARVEDSVVLVVTDP